MGRLGHLCNPKQARSNNNNKDKGVKLTEKQYKTNNTKGKGKHKILPEMDVALQLADSV